MSAAYNLFSLLPGEPNVGIWYLSQDLAGQPVRLDVDLIEWTARPSIIGRGPTQLSAGPYRYTRDRHGEVFATNDPVSNQDWFLIPSDYDNAYFVATDPHGARVWTAEEPRAPIRIKRFTGEPNQLFRFERVLDPGE